jgi:hypothetical protein
MMARRRRAALALVVGLMTGVTSRGLAQAVTVSLAAVNDSISPAPQILVQGTPGPPELGQTRRAAASGSCIPPS